MNVGRLVQCVTLCALRTQRVIPFAFRKNQVQCHWIRRAILWNGLIGGPRIAIVIEGAIVAQRGCAEDAADLEAKPWSAMISQDRGLRLFRVTQVSLMRGQALLEFSMFPRPLIVALLVFACCAQVHAQSQARDGSGNLIDRRSAPRDGAANLIGPGRSPRDGSGNLLNRGSAPRDGGANRLDRGLLQVPVPRAR